MKTLWLKLYALNLVFTSSFVFSERSVDNSSTDSHGKKNPTRKARPVNSADRNSCSSKAFDKLHGTFELSDQQKTYDIGRNTYIFSNRPFVPESSPLPLIEIEKEGSTSKSYPTSRGGVDFNNPIYNFNLVGWSYKAPQDSTFRTALAEGLKCALSDEQDFGGKLEKVLSDESIFKKFRGVSSQKDSEKEASESELAKARKMLDLYRELKKEILETKNNPLFKSFFEAVFNQIALTEDELRKKVSPMTFAPVFIKQVELLHSIKSKSEPSQQEKELLSYFEKQFSKEPRFSYLMNPLVASYTKTSIDNGVRNPDGKMMQAQGLKDFEENYLKRNVGKEFYSLSPTDLASKMFYDPKKKEIEFISSDPLRKMDETIERRISEIQSLEPKEQKSKAQALEQSIVAALNALDSQKYGPSPQMHALRQSLIRGLSHLAGDKQEAVHRIDQLSATDPQKLKSDATLFSQVGKKAELTLSNEALARFSNYDPVLKRVLSGLLNRTSSFGEKQKAELSRILQNGSSTDIMHALMMPEKGFHKAAVEELEAMGADKEAMGLLKELSDYEMMNKRQGEKYSHLRDRLKKEILAGGFSDSSFGKLTGKQKADLFVLAMLDEHGLRGVTARDEVPPTNPDHYDLGSLYNALNSEEKYLGALSKETGKSRDLLEREMREHVSQITGKSTGLTPKIRQTVLDRLNGRPSSHRAEMAVPNDIQMELLNFAGRVGQHSSGNLHSDKLAQGSLQKLLMLPLTQSAMDSFIADHTGPEAMRFYRSAEQYEGKKDGFSDLYEKGFFKPEVFKKIVEQSGSYNNAANTERQKLAEGILDFARAKLEGEIFKMRTEQSPDPERPAQVKALSGFIENYLAPAVSDETKLGLIEHLANDFLGEPSLFASKLAELFPKVDPADTQAVVRLAVDLLKTEGIKQHLGESLTTPMEKIKSENQKWTEYFDQQFKGLPVEDKALAEETLADFQRYRRALSANYQAAYRNPKDHVPQSWGDNAKQFFREIENLPRLLANFEEGSEAQKKVRDALLGATSNLEKKAEEEAKALHLKQKSVIDEVTDSSGAFKHNRVSYDPALNRIVIGKDSLIDQKLLDKLAELKNYNLFLESEGKVIAFNGQKGLEDWIREQRFKYGYSDASIKENGQYLSKGEFYLPLNENTAVKVFRGGDGTYQYQFEDAKKIQAELEADKVKLVERRAEYLKAQRDFKGGWNAGKSYFGNMGNWGFWDPKTSEEKALNRTYSEMMGALGRIEEAGHIEDATGMSGKFRSQRNRDEIQNKHLKDELAAIDSFLSKAETMHDLTVTFATLPAGNLLAARWLAAANAAKSAGAVAQAQRFLTAAKAAQAYLAATKGALVTAATFTTYGYGVEVGATALESWWGNGPKMIRAKEELYNKGKPWRKYADGLPFEGDFKGDKEAYHKALAEYEIEEAMDPDHNGIPNDHDSWGLDISLNGKQTGADLLWSPVEQFAGNAKFFQGLNIAKAAPGLARLGLPGEMAFAPLWTKFNPFFDPGLEKLKREEQKRREYVEHQSKKPERERSLLEIAGREMGMGAVEGFRFGASGIPTKMLTGALPKNSLSLALGTLSFIGTDEATKYAVNSAIDGKFRNPFENPEWKKEMAHSFVIGSYIGYGMAKGGQQSTYYSSQKEKLGISDKPGEKKTEEKAPERTSIAELVEKDFNGDEGQALLFLRTLTDREIQSAPVHVQTEFFKLMKKQGEKAVDEVRKFVQETGREDLKLEAAKLVQVIPELTSLEHLNQTRTLTPEEGAKLESMRLEQDLALYNLQQAIEPLKVAADKARARMGYLSQSLKDWTPKQKSQYEADQKTVNRYAESGARIQDAIIRMDTVRNFQGPVLMRTSVISPDSRLADTMLKGYPQARKALLEEAQRKKSNPTAWEQTLKGWKYLEDEHIAPNFSRGGTWWQGPQGFDGQNRMASITIQSVRNRSTSAETRSQLLDLLRIVDPKTAVNIERKEGK